MGDERLAKPLLYNELPGKRRQGRPGRTLAAQFQIDVKSALWSQQLKNVAEEAAYKASWNDLFSVTPSHFSDVVLELAHALYIFRIL